MDRAESGRMGYEKTKHIHEMRRKKFRKDYEDNPKRCQTCDVEIPYEKRTNKFCSRSCSAKFNNVGVRRHGEEHCCLVCHTRIVNNSRKKFCSESCRQNHMTSIRDRKKKNEEAFIRSNSKSCLECGNPISREHTKFCCLECRNLYKEKETIHLMETGGEIGPRRVRSFMIRNYGNTCMDENCVWDFSKRTVTIEVDHIDGNSENNKKENLRLLCPNCHSLTATYKGKNAGNGRAKRRERYHTGKSY